MPISAAYPIGLGLATLLGFGLAGSFKKKEDGGTSDGVPSEGPTAIAHEQAHARFTSRGPHGESVFVPDLAGSLVHALAGMVYSPDESDPGLVHVQAEPHGAPVTPELSAFHWAKAQNRTLSILMTVMSAIPTGSQKFLRAVPPGSEAKYATRKSGYAVLLYAGTLDHRMTPPGRPGMTPHLAPALSPTPLGRARKALPPQLRPDFQNLLVHGQDPDQMRKAALDLRNAGLPDPAALLHRKATNVEIAKASESSAPAAPGTFAPELSQAAMDRLSDLQAQAANAKRIASTLASNIKRGFDAATLRGPKPVQDLGTLSPVTVDVQSLASLPIVAIQTQLAQLGYLKSTNTPDGIDGRPGKFTSAAIKKFQADNGLPDSKGVMDAVTALTLAAAVKAKARPTVMAGGPMYVPLSMPLGAIYGPHPMDQYARIWGRQPW